MFSSLIRQKLAIFLVGVLVFGASFIAARHYSVQLSQFFAAPGDQDDDGVPDDQDNCPDVPNQHQGDNDGDGIGNVCDPTPNGDEHGPDTDFDGLSDDQDNCPTVPNPAQADCDQDGIGNLCDDTPGQCGGDGGGGTVCDASAAENLSGSISDNGPNGTANATITNLGNGSCSYDITLAAYNGAPNNVGAQTLFSAQTIHVPAGGSGSLSVGLPGCEFQVDLAQGAALQPPFYGGNNSSHYLVAVSTGGDCSGGGGTPTPTPAPTGLPNGAFDTLDCSIAEGWARDADSPSKPVRVQIFNGPAGSGPLVADSGPLSTSGQFQDFPTNITRTDNPWPFPDRDHGFVWTIPASLKDGAQHALYAYAIDNEDSSRSSLIANAPRSFTCPAATPTPTPACIPLPSCLNDTPPCAVRPAPGTVYCPASPTPVPSPTPTATPVPLSLDCTPAFQEADTNQSLLFSATGGTGAYSWSAPTATTKTGSSQNFTTSFTTVATHLVTVTSGGLTATCQAEVSLGATTPPPTATPTVTATVVLTATPTATPVPTPVPLVCAANPTTANLNTQIIFSGSGGVNAPASYVWNTAGGTSGTTTGLASIGVSFSTVGTKNVTVTDGVSTATCPVVIQQPPSGFVCNPLSQPGYVNQAVNFNVTGATGTPTWSAPNSAVLTGSGIFFNTSYGFAGNYIVTVTNGAQSASCNVTIAVLPPSNTPPPPVFNSPALSMAKSVRNMTTNSAEVENVPASPNDTIEFIIRVSSVGNATVQNVRVQDVLPAGLTYITNSTTLDGVPRGDGIIGGSISLGNMSPGTTMVVRFRATVAAESFFSVGTTTLTNVSTALSDNTPSITDPAFVNVTRNTPSSQSLSLQIRKFGRNITRGEFGEQSNVNASSNDTIEFIVRVRNTSVVRIDNVMARDVIPAYISYIPGTSSVNGIVRNDDLVSSAGLNIGSLDPNQEAVIRFSGRINPASTIPTGITTVINTAQAWNPQIPQVIAQLPIAIFNGQIAGVISVPTGAGESVLVAMAISALVTLMYITYTRSDIFRRREIEGIMDKQGDQDHLDFKD